MSNIKWYRFRQMIKFGWKDAKEIASLEDVKKSRISLFFDIMRCFKNYYIFSNQYKKKEFWKLSNQERISLSETIGSINKKRDKWIDVHHADLRFLNKYTKLSWSMTAEKRLKRNAAYREHYGLGENVAVQQGVIITCSHSFVGKITCGNNILFGKNSFIDYSGELIIHDNVVIANGVIIETHTHSLEKSRGGGGVIQSKLEIGEGVKVLTQSYIADTCHSIGRYARIGAGTYVRSNIPPYAIVMGNPAKIIGFLYSPEEMAEFERDKYPESERTPLDQYNLWFEKYFRSRSKERKSFIKL